MCEGHSRDRRVARTLGRQNALDDSDRLHVEAEGWDREIPNRGPDRLRFRGARVFDDAGERQVRRERAVVETEAPAPETRVHTRADLDHARGAVGDTQPHHARPATLGKLAHPIERQCESPDARGSFPRRGGDIFELPVGRLAEERERHVQVLWFHPAQSWQRRRQHVECLRGNVRRQRNRDEEAHASDGTAGG